MDSLFPYAASVINFAANLCVALFVLKRKQPVLLAVLSYVAIWALLLFLDLHPRAWLTIPGELPYGYLLYFLPMFFLFSGTIFQKMFVFFTQLFISGVISCMSVFLLQGMVGTNSAAYELVLGCAIFVLNSLFLYAVFRFGRKLCDRLFSCEDGWMWAVYAFGPCLGFVVLQLALKSLNGFSPALYPLMILFGIWSMAVLFLAVLATQAKRKAASDLVLAQYILEANKAQDERVKQMLETSRILRHDCKYHMNVMKSLLETGEREEADVYLKSVEEKFQESAMPLFCMNPTVNALLLSYHERSRAVHAAFTATVQLPDDLSINHMELCILLGNLLENALEACKMAPEESRKISLTALPHGRHLMISVENSFDGAVLQKNGHLVSRKGEEGGLGSKSIRAIADRHRGEYTTNWNQNEFKAYVLLQL